MKRWYRVYRESYCEVHAENEEDAKHEAGKLLQECWKNGWTFYNVHFDDYLNEDEIEQEESK